MPIREMVTSSGVTFVIPVRNGEQWLKAVLDGVLLQADGRPLEIIVVDDGSIDGSAEIVSAYARQLAERSLGNLSNPTIRALLGPRRGVTAALNEGFQHATHPIICQIDQDVVVGEGWMRTLTAALQDPAVAAAQGYYTTAPGARVWARVMGLDLEDRYHHLRERPVDHVCTGNTAYRADAVARVGFFDESLGYGYDNDISYRLVDAGYSLVIRDEARSTHWWRDTFWHYLVQQYGFGYGRLDLVAKHRGRVTGDDVSRLSMMLHAPLMLAAIVLFAWAGVLAISGRSSYIQALGALTIVSALAVERVIAGARATVRFRDASGLWFAPMHLARDVAWAVALVVWGARRIAGINPRPSHSMHPRSPGAERP